ncbi:P-type conjugative transfer protein TrbJ (plasmid) [Escherichia coli]|nr:P-type conjugative transfer protein TrbJ [Escherichia coli]MDM4889834.1 P-type conjugative transfer protein TrbJ [Escherichia coli]
MPPVLWRGWIPFCRCTERKKVRNKQVVLLIAGISGIATGIIVSLNIPFIRQGLFYPASPVEIVVSLCLTFSVSVVFFVGAIVGWISVSEIYYSRMNGLNESSEISKKKKKKKKTKKKKKKKKQDYYYKRTVFYIYFFFFFFFFSAPIFFCVFIHIFFYAFIYSWKAHPELNNFLFMWNILMFVIPYTLWAFAGGFFIVYVRNPLKKIKKGGIRIFRLKRRMRREKKLREGGNNASH